MTSEDPVGHRAALRGWPRLAGRDPSPPRIDDAQAAFQRGVDAHARGAKAQARAEFLRAAALIPEELSGAYAVSLDQLRRIARENAATAGGRGDD